MIFIFVISNIIITMIIIEIFIIILLFVFDSFLINVAIIVKINHDTTNKWLIFHNWQSIFWHFAPLHHKFPRAPIFGAVPIVLARGVGIVRHVAELLKIRSDPGLFAAVDHAAVAAGHLAAG